MAANKGMSILLKQAIYLSPIACFTIFISRYKGLLKGVVFRLSSAVKELFCDTENDRAQHDQGN